MADIAPPAAATPPPPQGPGPIRRLSLAFRNPFRRNSAASATETATSDPDVPSSPPPTAPRARDELPPIESQEHLASAPAAEPPERHERRPSFLHRVLSGAGPGRDGGAAPPPDARDVLPSSPHHARHPSDAHTLGAAGRYAFTAPELDAATPFDVLALNDVDVVGLASRGPDAPVCRKSTLQPDPLYTAERAHSSGNSSSHSGGGGGGGEHRKPREGLMVLDTGDFVQDHVLKAAQRVAHPLRRNQQAPWAADPVALDKDHAEISERHAREALAASRAEDQAKAARLEKERDQAQADHPHRTQTLPATLLHRHRSPTASGDHETEEEAHASVSDPSGADAKRSAPVAIPRSKTTAPADPGSGSPRSGSPGTSPVRRLTRVLSLNRAATTPTQPGVPVRHPGLIHVLDTGDVVQDKVIGAFSFMGGAGARRRSSAASATTAASPLQRPTSATSPLLSPVSPRSRPAPASTATIPPLSIEETLEDESKNKD